MHQYRFFRLIAWDVVDVVLTAVAYIAMHHKSYVKTSSWNVISNKFSLFILHSDRDDSCMYNVVAQSLRASGSSVWQLEVMQNGGTKPSWRYSNTCAAWDVEFVWLLFLTVQQNRWKAAVSVSTMEHGGTDVLDLSLFKNTSSWCWWLWSWWWHNWTMWQFA